jgi:uroporphyrinogen III methyltransferase/synthase
VTVYLVGAGPGDPGLLTRRGATLLARADVVLHDRLVSPGVLDLVPATATLIDVGKDPDAVGGGERQDEIARLLVEHGRTAAVVVRLKGGDPFLFGRGGEEVDALERAGVPWEVVPGVSSAFGVPAAVGIPVTQRGLASSVTVVTGRVGAPGADGGPDWEALARAGGTLVILMGMTTRGAIADALLGGGRAPDTPVAVIARGTTPSEQVARTTLAGLAAVELEAPAVIVVGPVAALGAATTWGRAAGPLAGRTVVVTRAEPQARGLVGALEEAGAVVVELPLTHTVDPADGGAALRAAAATVQEHQWVVLTSVNAVHRLMAELRDARALGAVLVAAVGPATADALRVAGVEPDLVPLEHSARGLVEAFLPPAGPGRRVLFPSAAGAADTVADGLGRAGWDVRRVEAYRTVPLPAPPPILLARVAAADALSLTATSAVEAFLALRTPDGAPVSPPPCVVCIGPTTAEAARRAGLPGVHEATEASAGGIVAALVAHFGAAPGGGS